MARAHRLPVANAPMRRLRPDVVVQDPRLGVGLERQPNGEVRLLIAGQDAHVVFRDAHDAEAGFGWLSDIARQLRDRDPLFEPRPRASSRRHGRAETLDLADYAGGAPGGGDAA